MARATLVKTNSPGKTASPQAAQTAGILLTMAASNTATGNQFLSTGKELVIARNTVTSAGTVTITSVADTLGRTGHITAHAIAASTINVYGPFPMEGWAQSTDSMIYVDTSATTVELGVVVLP